MCSMTVDTACSGSLVGVDVACRYLSTREIDGAIVAGANMYLRYGDTNPILRILTLTYLSPVLNTIWIVSLMH